MASNILQTIWRPTQNYCGAVMAAAIGQRRSSSGGDSIANAATAGTSETTTTKSTNPFDRKNNENNHNNRKWESRNQSAVDSWLAAAAQSHKKKKTTSDGPEIEQQQQQQANNRQHRWSFLHDTPNESDDSSSFEDDLLMSDAECSMIIAPPVGVGGSVTNLQDYVNVVGCEDDHTSILEEVNQVSEFGFFYSRPGRNTSVAAKEILMSDTFSNEVLPTKRDAQVEDPNVIDDMSSTCSEFGDDDTSAADYAPANTTTNVLGDVMFSAFHFEQQQQQQQRNNHSENPNLFRSDSRTSSQSMLMTPPASPAALSSDSDDLSQLKDGYGWIIPKSERPQQHQCEHNYTIPLWQLIDMEHDNLQQQSEKSPVNQTSKKPNLNDFGQKQNHMKDVGTVSTPISKKKTLETMISKKIAEPEPRLISENIIEPLVFGKFQEEEGFKKIPIGIKQQSMLTHTNNLNPKLQLSIGTAAAAATAPTIVHVVVNTPDVVNNVLDLESSNLMMDFDLVDFINSLEETTSLQQQQPRSQQNTNILEKIETLENVPTKTTSTPVKGSNNDVNKPSLLEASKETSMKYPDASNLPSSTPPPPMESSSSELFLPVTLSIGETIPTKLHNNNKSKRKMIRSSVSSSDCSAADESISPVPKKRRCRRRRRSSSSDFDDDDDFLLSDPSYCPSDDDAAPFSCYSKTNLLPSTSTAMSTDQQQPSPPVKRRRGRPPKVTSAVPVHQVAGLVDRHLTAAQLRYLELRNKNNEASRRSRIHRKARDQLDQEEADELRARHIRLVAQDQRLERLCKFWKDRLIQLALA